MFTIDVNILILMKVTYNAIKITYNGYNELIYLIFIFQMN